ncbi:MAG: choice-of-anchor D domain-containing protein [Deltaproteobacteria bacterium]|nr:choice-of-anchor D domain-containing protein [Deltaproteobacteria bacterium]
MERRATRGRPWLLLLAITGCEPSIVEPDTGPHPDTSVDAAVVPPGQPELVLDPRRLELGDVPIGESSAPLELTLTNRGTATTSAIRVSVGGDDASHFRLTSNACEDARLDPGDACVVEVVLSPALDGPLSATITTTAGDLVERATLVGSGLTNEGLSVSPSPFDFGDVQIGGSRSQLFTITHPGSATSGSFVVALGGLDPSQFTRGTDGCDGVALSPGESCSIDVLYAPSVAGMHTATLQATATPGGTTSAALLGTGLPIGDPFLEPSTHDFGESPLGVASAAQGFSVRNTGTGPTEVLSTVLAGANPSDFRIASEGDGCAGTSLPAMGVCTLYVEFVPTTAGARAATLRLTSASGPAVSAALSGTGTSS